MEEEEEEEKEKRSQRVQNKTKKSRELRSCENREVGLVSFCPPSLVSHTVCLWTKSTIKEEKARVSELRSCVNREGAWTLIP